MKVEKTGKKPSEKKVLLVWGLELSIREYQQGWGKSHKNTGFCSSSPAHLQLCLSEVRKLSLPRSHVLPQ